MNEFKFTRTLLILTFTIKFHRNSLRGFEDKTCLRKDLTNPTTLSLYAQ